MEMTVSIVGFLACLFLVGLYTSRKISDHEDWLVAGRNLGILPLTGTIFATTVSTVSLLGYMGYYYQMGWGGWWNWGGSVLSFTIGALFFAKKLRNLGKVTLSEMLEARYGKTHALIASVIILAAMIFFLSAQLTGSATVVQSVIPGLDRGVIVITVGLVFIFFTVAGGMEAVAWTDTFCAGIIFVGTIMLMFSALGMVGGIGKLHETLAEVKPSTLSPFADGAIPIAVAFSWVLTWGIGNYGAPHIITRINSAKNADIAAWSMAWTSVASFAFYLPLMIIGLCGIILFPGIAKPDMVAPTMIQKLLSPWGAGIMMASVLAAAISTATSVLLMAGTTFVQDIMLRFSEKERSPKEILKISRIATLVIGILGMVFTFYTNAGVLWIQANMIGIMGGALSVIVLAAFSWRRGNSQGALAAMIGGCMTSLGWLLAGKPFGLFPIIPGCVVAVILLVVVSLATEPPAQSVIDEFFPQVS